MIEIQCTSCLTRYRIEPSVLPAEKPTFKCSRCGHVFSAEPRRVRNVPPSPLGTRRSAPEYAASPSVSPPASPQAKPGPVSPAAAAQAQHGTEEPNPLSRSFAEHEDFKPGENLSFDFAEDFGPASEPVEPPTEPVKETRWQVGTFDPPIADEFRRGPSEITEPLQSGETAGIPYQFPDAFTKSPVFQREPEADEDDQSTHSSGFFLMVFALLLVSFTAASVLISNQAAASRDLLSRIPGLADYFAKPAPAVALRDIHTGYQRLKDNQVALLISGTADNIGQRQLHAVQIAISLLDPAQRELARQEVYCGNQIAPKMIAEMTPRELEFFGKLDPPKTFVVNPGESSSFQAVFIAPPAQTHGFHLAVVDVRTPEGSASPRS